MSTRDYYPFGSVMEEERLCGINDYRFGFQGEDAEEDTESGWNQFELRMYDSNIGRFISVDPYAQYASPYMGMSNNPVNEIDPDGGHTWSLNTKTGKLTWVNSVGGDDMQFVMYEGSSITKTYPGSELDAFYVGPVALNYEGDFQFSTSNMDLWTDVPDHYLGHYTGQDLVHRYKAMNSKGPSYKEFILEGEKLASSGVAQPETSHIVARSGKL